MNPRVLKRFVIICGISTFVMFTLWMIIKSFRDRPPGDYETQVCDQRLKDKLWDQAIEQANIAFWNKTSCRRCTPRNPAKAPKSIPLGSSSP